MLQCLKNEQLPRWQSILLAIFIYLLPLSLLAKERIGVMDFTESDGLPRDTGKTAATYAIMALLDSQKYSVIEKSTVEFILKEQALQKKGCTDTECAIQTGKLIAANLMLTGNIIDLNGKFVVSINIRNIEQGKVEFSETTSIASLKELESIVTGSIERFAAKGNKESVTKLEIPTLNETQERALAYTYVWPGLGHLTSEQRVKGSLFMSGSLYYAYNLLKIVPDANKQSRQDIITDYRAGIGILGTIDTTSPSGFNNASTMFGILYQDELRREWLMHTRTLNSGYFLLAAVTIIHSDLHITVLNNHVLKYFHYFYMNIFPEKPTTANAFLENRNFNPRYEITFTWRF